MSLWQWVVGLVLIVHGVGQLLGVVALTRLGSTTWNARSWLLTDAIGEAPSKAVSAVLWCAAFTLFVVAGLGVLGVVALGMGWRPFAVAGAVVSLVALALFWRAFPVLVPNKVGSIAVNLTALVGILIADWPTDAMLTT